MIGRRARRGVNQILVALGALLAAASVQAQARPLDVPANAGWQHAATGLVLMPRLAGHQRTSLDDNTESELDVFANFQTPDQSSVVTIYLFRPALLSVPVWFDRSETMIQLREEYHGVQPVAEARAFAPPTAHVASGLRRTYRTGSDNYKATGLAIMPMAEWLVAIRISERDPDVAALDSKLDAVIAALRWPAGVAEAPEAVLVAPCASPLSYARRARLQKPDMTDTLLGAALLGVANQRAANDDATDDGTPVVFCREGANAREYGVYRNSADLARESYVMAVGDAGRTISLAPNIGGQIGGTPGYTLTFSDLDQTLIFPNFDKLAAPEKALEAVSNTQPVSSVARGDGNTVNIHTGGN